MTQHAAFLDCSTILGVIYIPHTASGLLIDKDAPNDGAKGPLNAVHYGIGHE